jgi:cyclic pyranopterin phosphate synthase
MVNIGRKEITNRMAIATSRIEMPKRICDAVFDSSIQLNSKGNILGTSIIAGTVGAKKTAELIPLCHQVPLNQVSVDIHRLGECTIEIRASAEATARTGVEMEALTAVSVASLTLYDMTKSALKNTSDKIIIKEIQLLDKRISSSD